MAEQKQVVIEQAGAGQSAGQVLKQAREAAGLSVDEVARRLNLLASVVLDIEADDYSRIRGETFVRGYLLNYAKLLHLPGEQLVGNYKDGRSTPTVGYRNSLNSVPLWKRWWAAATSNGKGMVFLVICAGLVFWVVRDDSVLEPAALPDSVTVETVDGVTVVDIATGDSELHSKDVGSDMLVMKE